ncbi:TonB-dependent receptor [Flavisolibacter nicotianae]|uniref:TonB-dependent receptor n=1 Tax=Flavisolibacter nicotianae TaxID=2364882 RepID=UPI000EB32BD8|nr:TonB-dependent receptor [Flavisolibacter nicotianae]
MKNLILLILLGATSLMVQAQKNLLLTPYRPTTSKASINEFLQDVNRQTGTVIEYSSTSFEADKFIKLEGNEATVGAVLQKVLEGQKVKLLEHNNKIILVPSAEPFTIVHLLPARYSFFGYLKEEESKEPLINATIYEPISQRGVVSNNQGYFNFLLPEGKHTLEISYGGLQPVILELNMRDNVRKDISLSVKTKTHSNIVVESESLAKDGAIKLSSEQPLSNGGMSEVDPLQSIYLSAGVQQASTSFSEFQVRGGGVDQNLFLLDGNPVFNPTHMLGAVSIVNPTVLNGMRLYKSDFPAKLSGSLSSVLDVYTKEGHQNAWHGEANAGLLAGALTLEGPLVKNRTALMVSARKNISPPFYQSLQDGTSSDFYDAHVRMTTILDANNKLALNLYKGKDLLRQGGKNTDNLHQWGNLIGSLGWNSTLGSRSFIHTSVNYSQFQDLGSYQYTLFNTDEEDGDQKVKTKYLGAYSSIQHYNAQSQAEIYASKKVKFNIGVKLAQTNLRPFDSQINTISEDDEKAFSSFAPLHVEEFSSHVETEIMLAKKLFVKPGVHASTYQFEQYRNLSFQPRFYLAYRVTPRQKLFASYARMNQFLHLLTNPYAGINQDVWVPSTEGLRPEESDIYNVGYEYRYPKAWKFSANAYYKRLKNVTNFAEGKSFLINDRTWEQNVEPGKGRSYGMEAMIEKTSGSLFLKASYALSWSWRQFRSINNGREFPYKYDHRHTAALGLTYVISPHLNISGVWNFATGNVYTQAERVFTGTQQPSGTLDDDPLEDYDFSYHYSESSQYRAKNFQRYDLALDYHSRGERKLYSAFKAGIYHVSGLADLYSYTLSGSLSSKSINIKTGNSVLKIMPYVSYTLKF